MGNPGAAYAATRHNAGFLLADAVADRWRLPAFRRSGPARVTVGEGAGTPIAVVKPQTYMNLSGAALRPLLADPEFDPARDLLVLVDDAAIPLGTFRLRARGSAGGHNGLRSVEDTLRSHDYARLRVGVGPPPDGIEDLADFVLAAFTADEMDALEPLWPVMTDAVECWVTEGIDEAMQRFNPVGNRGG
ncbi:MAG TPA: aminoacyl-tRNA hydrolase [Gemmatimonadales bacterium]